METKKEIRSRMLKKRASFLQEERLLHSDCIADEFLARMEYRNCGTLFCYVSFRNEVDTHKIIKQALRDGKQVAVPRVEGTEMHFYRIASLQELVKSSFGIPEPGEDAQMIIPAAGDLMVVPGAAFDTEGYRIGYGGGYYDRYLRNYPDVYTIGLAYDFQMVKNLPRESYDLAVSDVIFSGELKRN